MLDANHGVRTSEDHVTTLSRRQVLQGTALAAASAAVPFGLVRALAQSPATGAARRLRIDTRTIEVAGKSAKVFGLLNPENGHGLTFNAGEDFNVVLENNAAEPTLIHWHGLTPPWRQDGVPGVSQDLLAPGNRYDYRFGLARSGTNWMHAHTLQEQELLAAPLIIRDPAEQGRDEREIVMLLHDFSFKSPQEMLAGLKDGAAGDGMGAMDHSKMDHSAMGHGAMPGSDMAGMDHGAMGGMVHANDIEYDAYLANDRTLDDPEVIGVAPGERVRLRIINAAAATAFTIDLGELEGELIAVDGMPIMPLRVRSVPLAMAQRADIRLTVPKDTKVFPILALREDSIERTGIILAAKGVTVTEIGSKSETKSPLIDLSLETGLRAARPLQAKSANRRYEMELTGTHDGYKWGFNIQTDGQAVKALTAKTGERIEVRMRNTTMMPHPMHLHGHHFQVVAINDKPLAGAMRDTVAVPPNATVTIAFDADNAGRWMFHCHHLYHMSEGMMTEVLYEDLA